MKSKVYIETFGCQMNVADTERAATGLRKAGYELTASAQGADVVLLNTCSVRERAERKVFRRIGEIRKQAKLQKQKPLIGVMGCVAQLEGSAIFQNAPAVDLIVGTRATDRLTSLIERVQGGEAAVIDLDERQEGEVWDVSPAERRSPYVAFVPIIEGCNKFCSFCIVPYSRGREKSRSALAIVNEVQGLWHSVALSNEARCGGRATRLRPATVHLRPPVRQPSQHLLVTGAPSLDEVADLVGVADDPPSPVGIHPLVTELAVSDSACASDAPDRCSTPYPPSSQRVIGAEASFAYVAMARAGTRSFALAGVDDVDALPLLPLLTGVVAGDPALDVSSLGRGTTTNEHHQESLPVTLRLIELVALLSLRGDNDSLPFQASGRGRSTTSRCFALGDPTQ